MGALETGTYFIFCMVSKALIQSEIIVGGDDLRYFYLSGEEITEEEAKHIEAQNREILRDGTVEELLQIRHIIYYLKKEP